MSYRSLAKLELEILARRMCAEWWWTWI